MFQSFNRSLRSTRRQFTTTNSLNFLHPHDVPERPIFQILSSIQVSETAINKEDAIKLYSSMVRLNVMDRVFYDAQRQGRISFYMTSTGEEAATVGSAAGLHPEDEVFAQYREQGVLIWRGFSLQEFADQLFGNHDDVNKGRQMPVHYGSKKLHFQTISSPLATQIPQAAGAAYGLKESKSRIVACYFGEGAASEGDFHAGLNFASALHCPVLYICRNNGFAISTPVKEQSGTEMKGIASRALGYGMTSIQVDGNDVLAMKQATEEAREWVLANQRPLLLEALTYRVGHHSTSDDSTRYRSLEEIEQWRVGNNPLERFKSFLLNKSWWTQSEDDQLKENERSQVLLALSTAEHKAKPDMMESLFQDVFAELPNNLQQQQTDLQAHFKAYPVPSH